jgi:hypothetical protein
MPNKPNPWLVGFKTRICRAKQTQFPGPSASRAGAIAPNKANSRAPVGVGGGPENAKQSQLPPGKSRFKCRQKRRLREIVRIGPARKQSQFVWTAADERPGPACEMAEVDSAKQSQLPRAGRVVWEDRGQTAWL